MKTLNVLWKKWQAFGKALGDLIGRVVMTVFYFTVAAPFGLGVRLFRDPLGLKPQNPQWYERSSEAQPLEDARRAY